MKRILLVVLLAGCAPKPATVGGTPTPDATVTPIADAGELTEAERERQARIDAARVTPVPEPSATPVVSDDDVTAEVVPVLTPIWTAETPLAVDKDKIQSKDGVLRKNVAVPNDENQTRYYPYSIDYWGLTTSGIDAILDPHVGKEIRVTGHYRKIWNDGKWTYEVDPASIHLLPAAKKP